MSEDGTKRGMGEEGFFFAIFSFWHSAIYNRALYKLENVFYVLG